MRSILTVVLLSLLTSCSSPKRTFKKELVCTNQAMKYLENPRNIQKLRNHSPLLIQEMASTTQSMQLCYEDFKNRVELEEFNTCLVVGVDENGKVDFYNFGSSEIKLDRKFLECAHAVTRKIQYESYGTNYILLQAYNFYVEK